MDFFVMIWEYILSIANTFRIQDVIDIAILSYIIYKGIKIVRETRAQQLIKGLLLLVAAFIVSNIFELKALEFILKNVFSIGAIALIVVFQPELRRVLDKVGRTKVRDLSFGLAGEHTEYYTKLWGSAINAICDACEQLSQTKTGALIVLERQTKLGEQIATGVTIDAVPSKELFGNIFFKNSPLHDGAVIMRDGKIIAASCFLPKPVKEEHIDRQLGSRHRAAIGISENSDAVTVVVSEETGSISVSEDGFLTRHLSKDDLYRILTEKMISEKADEEKPAFWKVRKNEKK